MGWNGSLSASSAVGAAITYTPDTTTEGGYTVGAFTAPKKGVYAFQIKGSGGSINGPHSDGVFSAGGTGGFTTGYLLLENGQTVYVGYGADGESARSKTMYTGTFKPTGRPAPGDQVTPDQINAWDALVAEVNLAISATNTATSNANAAAAVANKWGNVTTSVETLPEGSAATFEVTETGTGKNMKVGVPRGATVAQGPQGPQGIQGPMGPTGPAGVTFSMSGRTLIITTV